MDVILGIALISSIIWATICGYFALVLIAAGGGAQHPLEKIGVLVVLVLGFGPLVYVISQLVGGG